MGNIFNRYFSEIGPKLDFQIGKANVTTEFSCTSLIKDRSQSFYSRPISTSDVLQQLRHLNPDKSAGPEGIPRKYLKMRALIIAPILAELYNTCIQTGIYPTILKVGQILPIFKSGAKDVCSNYRPISLLSPLTKIFEKYLYGHSYTSFEKFHILTHNQFGFKRNSLTPHAVRELYDEVSESLDQQKTTCALLLDLKKTFDTVNHCILLKN